ncbi:MAG: peptidoglycan DD-metalloendopeptidase family protein [Firmicutes bacterium]|nr:peptidoglycan DD-metalloendopeptidase family protein [Bacillota bacterium]
MDNRQHIDEASYVKRDDGKPQKPAPARMIQRAVSSLLVLAVLAALVFAGVDMVSATSRAYKVYVDGQEIATMVSEREANDALELAVQAVQERVGGGNGFTVTYSNDVEVQEIPSVGEVYSSAAEVAEKLGAVLDFQAEGVALLVDDVPAFYVSSAGTAIQAVNAAKAHFASPEEEDVSSIYTEQRISIVSCPVSLTEVLSESEAVNMLLFGDADADHDSEYSPMIDVIVERAFSQEEPLPYETVREDDDTMLRGTEEVVTEGVDGTQLVHYTQIERNGVLEDTVKTGADVLVPAVDEVIHVGTRLLISGAFSTAGNGELGWPLMDGVGIVSSRFGWRDRGWHSGIDIANAIYTTIVAAEDGVVTTAEYQGGYGLLLCISHSPEVETRYAHCAEFFVGVGDSVKRGQPIAVIGMTGTTTGPHVHFEVRINGTAVDPLPYL